MLRLQAWSCDDGGYGAGPSRGAGGAWASGGRARVALLQTLKGDGLG
jgi:hypothetical protein